MRPTLTLFLCIAVVACTQAPRRAATYCDAVEEMLDTRDQMLGSDALDRQGHERWVAAARDAQRLAPEALRDEWDIAVRAIDESYVEGEGEPTRIEGRFEAFKTLNADAQERCGVPVLRT